MNKKMVWAFLMVFLLVLTFSTGCKKAEEQVSEAPPATAPSAAAPSASAPGPEAPPPGELKPAPAAPQATALPQGPAVPPAPVPGAAPGQVPASPAPAEVVYAARFTSAGSGVPFGWELDHKSGTPALRIEPDGGQFCLHLSSDPESSYGIKQPVKVNLGKYPFLNWRWRVSKLPKGGSVKSTKTDDQALQLYVAFQATGWPAKLNTPIIGYIWDNESPKEWMGRSSQIGARMLRYVVVRNRTDRTGEWYTEKRNVLQDYKKLFPDVKGGDPPRSTQGIEIYINSQHTRSVAESSLCDAYFSGN